ncbi:uncharacterized protein DUF4352 [Barrientosiimonas humi]|uniref:Uncharacterized protein DUF4352 n=1 Tax=Barrientosiimonas humi TaxID=999931 RepID=A0A542XGH9_9MICO|nr:DUF4352 domain-containing protein [Barrientosiimonas humi]TQL34922.1 uncharacterized protein DUF4352 [Barrientosiimonas humi]
MSTPMNTQPPSDAAPGHQAAGGLPPVPPQQFAYPPMQEPQKKSWFARHKIITGLGALLLVAGGVSAAQGGSGGTTTDGSSNQAAAPADNGGDAAPAAGDGDGAQDAAPAADDAKPVAKKDSLPGLNAPVRDGKFEFTVTKVETGKTQIGDQYVGEKAQGQFTLVTVTVKNIGDEPQTLIDTEQQLTDGSGRQYTSNTMAALLLPGNENAFITDINPGNNIKAVLVYDMAKGAKPTTIQLHDSMFSGGVKVDLTK